jgi:hypothetical protein
MDNTQPIIRYRCDLCGNITRFDVTETMTIKSFYHYGIDGQLNKEDAETLNRIIESVSCRWCNSPSNVKEVKADEVGTGDDTSPKTAVS